MHYLHKLSLISTSLHTIRQSVVTVAMVSPRVQCWIHYGQYPLVERHGMVVCHASAKFYVPLHRKCGSTLDKALTGIILLNIIVLLQLQHFVTGGRDKLCNMTEHFKNSGGKIVDRRAFLIKSLIQGYRWSSLIKVRPVVLFKLTLIQNEYNINTTNVTGSITVITHKCNYNKNDWSNLTLSFTNANTLY